jgi:amino acid adenylation domain-containing protein
VTTDPPSRATTPELSRLLAELSRRGVEVTADGEKLVLRSRGGAVTPELREELVRNKAELLRHLAGGAAPPPDGPRNDGAGNGPQPLSFAQENLWFLDQMGHAGAAYHAPLVLFLSGPLALEALRKSLSEIVRRHHVLRSTFTAVEGAPRQVVGPAAEVPLSVCDLAPLSPDEQRRRWGVEFAEELERAFDLARGPLVRARLFRLGDAQHVLALTVHHIAWDAWSAGVFTTELAALYEAFAAGRPSPLPELRAQYADFARRERESLQGERLEALLAYWRERLEDAPATELATDVTRKRTQSFRGTNEWAPPVSGDVVAALKRLGQDNGTTLFTVLLAAFKALLHRCTGQQDLVVGTPMANRPSAEFEGLAGLFVNNLVLRTRVDAGRSFEELLSAVRATVVGAVEHAEMPFARLVAELRQQRDPSRTPLFQIFFNMATLASPAAGAGLVFAPVAEEFGSARFDLTVYAAERAGHLSIAFNYNTDLFAPETVRRLVAQYVSLLEAVAARPQLPIGAHSLLTGQCRAVVPDPSTVLETPALPLVVDLVRSWADETPDAPALAGDGRTLSYAELSARASRVARALTASGVAPADVVALDGRPAFGTVAAFLGTLMAGGVVLFLDPALPAERRRQMIREAGVRHIVRIGEEGREQENDALPLRAVLEVDGATAECAPPAVERPLPALAGADAAYVFFTSGTTGVPKAVLGTHGGLSHFVLWQRDTFGISPGDRGSHLTSLSFDVVLREMLLPLVSGATLCLPVAEGRDPDRVLAWIEREGITVVHTVPSLAAAWLSGAVPGARASRVRLVFFAGEPLTGRLASRFREASSAEATVVNLYGPTETTLAKCFHVVPADGDDGIQPVGRPLPQTQALVLGTGDRPCAVGEVGEVVLRTPFRTRGYLNAEEEQQRRFVPNPWRTDPGDLLYRTGDRGQLRADGTLHVRGRVDDQVKIGGVRVEPGETTAVLARHPAVRSCAVVARDDKRGRRLVAYVVATEASRPCAEELRAFLRERLPEAFIPAAFVLLDALPLTANGKLDRRALPEPPEPARDGFVSPRSAEEEAIAAIWREVLGAERVSVHEDFFALGGHSLGATQVVSRIRARLGVELPLGRVFEAATIEALAARVVEARQQPALAPLARLARRPRPPVVQAGEPE